MATYAYLCPTPRENCCGAIGNYSQSLEKKGIKRHGSAAEAMACYSRYLIGAGYTKISAREFRPADGGPILVLSKLARFGARLRSGKSGETGQGNSRGMPAVRYGGVIIST